MTLLPQLPPPLRETRSVCCYCGVGCGVVLQARGDRIVGVRGDDAHPANRGQLCSKGRELHETVHLADRLLFPELRATKDAPRMRVSWDEALARAAIALREARARRGPEAIGFHLSGQLLTEDYYAFHKLAKGFLGTSQIDSNSRLCMSTAVSGYQRAFGVDGPPCSYEDLELADLLLVVGANMAWCHPILFRRIERARERADRPALVVLDPRRTATAEVADLHVALRPGSDGVFLMGVLAELARRGGLDRGYIERHTENFEAVELALLDFPAARIERECGVSRAILERVATLFRGARAVLSLWAMGVNQSAHGTDTVSALVDLHLATGQLGRPGAGPFSLTGQPNAMGGRETGAMATLLPAHRSLADTHERREVEALWRCPELPAAPGRTAVELFQHAADGGLDVLWIAGTNPVVSMPEQAIVRRALERTPLVIVQEVCATTETAAYADLCLPAAGWAEKSGTMTNSERRVARVRRAIPPPGECLPDWEIAARVALRLGFGEHFAWEDDAEVWAEHVRTTAGRDCDMTGLTRERLDAAPLQWPCPSPAHPGTPRLYTDARFPTPSGRARFVVPTRFANAEVPAPGELSLTTGRGRDQWHTMTKTGAVPELCEHAPEPRLELAPVDAERLGVGEGEPVRVRGARGAFAMRVAVSDALREGVAFAPMHFGEARAAGGSVNRVMPGTLDPASKQPELKHAAVRVERLARPSGRVVIVGAGHAGVAVAEALRALDPAREIVLVGAEAHAPYDRVRLPEVIAGRAGPESIVLADAASLAARRIELRTRARAVAVDAGARVVRLEGGERLAYQSLVLATGGRPVRPALPGIDLHGVRSLRGLDDVLALRAEGLVARRVVVYGTGLLGVEAADALRSAGAEVTLVGRASRVLRRELDARASVLVAEALAARGVSLRLGAEVEGFLGEERVSAVRLRGGEELPAHAVILALGVAADLALARSAALACGERIAVDAALRTSDPAIFGLGEAAEQGGAVACLVAAVRAQAEVLARTLAGDETAWHRPQPPLTVLELSNLSLRACGELAEVAPDARPECHDVVYQDHGAGIYRRLVLRRGRLAGFVAVGPCPNAAELHRTLVRGLRLRAPADVLLFPGLAAALGTTGDRPEEASRVVCACHAVSESRIRAAIEAGATDVAAVGAACAAGTGCGSCRPEIAALLRPRERAALPLSPPRTKEGPAMPDAAASPRTLVVIGNGMVGHRFVEALRERDAAGAWRVVVLGEEARPAYDRVHLSELFAGRTADDLALATAEAYREEGVELHLGERASEIDRAAREVRTGSGTRIAYDAVVLATGSAPFVPPVPGTEKKGVFVYRTVEDVAAIRAWAACCREAPQATRRAVVIGGGLLGLEAAKAARDLGLETHVVEVAQRLMPRQLDEAGSAALARRIRALGITLHLGAATEAFVGDEAVRALRFRGGKELPVDLVIVSAGIRPRDELARAAGLACGERGGVVVDDGLVTSDPRIFAIGEVACHAGMVYGLVGPGYEMAEVLAQRLAAPGEGVPRFAGADVSTKLKLLGVDVASLGDPFAEGEALRSLVFQDAARDVYAKLLLDVDAGRLVGGVLVGDASQYGRLLQLAREGAPLPEKLEELLFGPREAGGADAPLPDTAQVCSCNNVSCGAIRSAFAAGELADLAAVKKATKAGTGCGGCLPSVEKILKQALAARGIAASSALCEHFALSRQELFQVVKIKGHRTFEALLESHGRGSGCEICKPAVASILASLWNEPIQGQATIQDTNDRFLANIQRGGTYSVVPRVPGGEITPEKLIVLGEVAKRYGLYCKITGGQRIDLLGARVDQLPDIWRDLVSAGFESGHAYGKAMRTVKSCVGSTWCRYGVQDSTALAIRIEERYRGVRAPHKLKSAVSGCIRECAEAQSKDFGIIATEKGWNLYVCGNGGAKPRHAELLAADLDEQTLVRFCDRFLMYYIATADRLTRTARWLEGLPGGIEYLRQVVIDDRLGIGAELEARMQHLVDTYACEWREVVDSPELQKRFRHFANDRAPDDSLRFVEERGQKRPADWEEHLPAEATRRALPPLADGEPSWVPLAAEDEVPRDGGIAVRYGDAQIALFRFASRGAWYATQNACPHTQDQVLARGLLGDERGRPKVACPQHKKTFSLETGEGLSDPAYRIATFPVRVEDGKVMVLLPPARALLPGHACGSGEGCSGCGGADPGDESAS